MKIAGKPPWQGGRTSELRYVSWLAWVKAKQLLHLPIIGDRNFFVERFVRDLDKGLVGEGCHITAAGRRDGAGAQAQAIMSAICLAKAYRLTYVHTPFELVTHAECAMQEWVAAWEALFNFGHGSLRAHETALPRVSVVEFMSDKRWRRRSCLLVVPYYNKFTDMYPDAYHDVIPSLRANYYLNRERNARTPVIDVCIHVRRGDVRFGRRGTEKLTPDKPIIRTIVALKQTLAEMNLPHRMQLFSQGAEMEFSEFSDIGCNLNLDTPAIDVINEFIEADILVMARSAFSYVAAILCDGVKLYDPYDRPPLTDWIVRDREGTFDRSRFDAQVRRHLENRTHAKHIPSLT